jgi:hypothetical protein
MGQSASLEQIGLVFSRLISRRAAWLRSAKMPEQHWSRVRWQNRRPTVCLRLRSQKWLRFFKFFIRNADWVRFVIPGQSRATSQFVRLKHAMVGILASLRKKLIAVELGFVWQNALALSELTSFRKNTGVRRTEFVSQTSRRAVRGLVPQNASRRMVLPQRC